MKNSESNKSVTNIARFNDLLEESKASFISRNLKKALNTARIARDFAQEAGFVEKIFDADLLLAQIYSKNGFYLSDDSYFEKSLAYLNELEAFEIAEKEENQFLIQKAKGQVFFNMERFPDAENYLQKGLNAAQDSGNIRWVIEFQTGLAQLEILRENYAQAYTLAQNSLDQFQAQNYLPLHASLLAEIYQQLSQALIKRHAYSKALEYAQILLSIGKDVKDAEKELNALNIMAIVSGVKANYKIAMQYFQEALDKSEAIGFRHNIAHCLTNIATIYAHLYNYNDALERYQSVLIHYKDVLDDYNKVIIYNNVGNIQYTIGNYDEAKVYFQKALTLAKEKEIKEVAAHALAQLSRTFTAIGNLNIAENLANEALKQIEPLGNINGNQINLINLGDICFQKGDYTKAIQFVENGMQAAKEFHDDLSEINGLNLLASIYESLEDYEKAYIYQKKFSESSSAFRKIQTSRQFLDLEIKNALKEKQKEIHQLTKENEYQALLLDKSDQIEQKNQELLQMNDDLKQFAYIASHDLKEPLRMVSSYAQIIYKLYKDKFDENAGTYFNYITEGVDRMNNLLEALLKYATVGKTDEGFELVDLGYIVQVSKVNLQVLIQETGAEITFEQLPPVYTIKSLMIQLLQNLISNAIKFRAPDIKPVIHISSLENESDYIVSVKDNGIGIAKENIERIFVVFQRLHARSKYDGTGIGLAICQKIMQRLNGKIWVESIEGEGSTFFFSIPKSIERSEA